MPCHVDPSYMVIYRYFAKLMHLNIEMHAGQLQLKRKQKVYSNSFNQKKKKKKDLEYLVDMFSTLMYLQILEFGRNTTHVCKCYGGLPKLWFKHFSCFRVNKIFWGF
jgi:hypothetical protein